MPLCKLVEKIVQVSVLITSASTTTVRGRPVSIDDIGPVTDRTKYRQCACSPGPDGTPRPAAAVTLHIVTVRRSLEEAELLIEVLVNMTDCTWLSWLTMVVNKPSLNMSKRISGQTINYDVAFTQMQRPFDAQMSH